MKHLRRGDAIGMSQTVVYVVKKLNFLFHFLLFAFSVCKWFIENRIEK